MDQAAARQELAAIRALMAESQGFLGGSWRHQLVWGLLGASGLTATWWAVSAGSAVRPGWIWLALGVTLTLIGAASILTGTLAPRSLPGLIALVFGAGYFASGLVAGVRWLAGVGVGWWVAGAGLLQWSSGPGSLLVLAGLTLVLEVGPALALRRLERSGAAG